MNKNNLKIKIEIYAVISDSIGLVENKVYRDRFDKLMNEILDMSNDIISIQKVSETDLVNELIDKEHREGLFTTNTILKFTYNSDCRHDFSETPAGELSKTLYTNSMGEYAIQFLSREIFDSITCANICMPGVLAMKKYLIYKDGKYIRTVDFFTLLNTVQKISSNLPDELYNKKINLLACVSWFKKIEVKNGYSTTPLGRAVALLNRLLFSELRESNETILDLSNMFIAIEALYCTEHKYKTKQIFHHTKNIVSLKNRKEIKKFYNNRSRFVHGDTDFPLHPSLPEYVLLDSDDEKLNQTKEHFYKVICLLFETLQYMLLNKKHKLNFKGYKQDYILE